MARMSRKSFSGYGNTYITRWYSQKRKNKADRKTKADGMKLPFTSNKVILDFKSTNLGCKQVNGGFPLDPLVFCRVRKNLIRDSYYGMLFAC